MEDALNCDFKPDKRCTIKGCDKCHNKPVRKYQKDVQSASNAGLDAAIRVFNKRIDEYNAWYMSQERVSLATMVEQDDLMEKCHWAIELLKKEQGI